MAKQNIFELANINQEQPVVALETIEFQNNEFGKSLEAVFEEILVKCKDAKDVKTSDFALALSKAIKQYTNLTVEVNFSSESLTRGPEIQLPHFRFEQNDIALYQEHGLTDKANLAEVSKLIRKTKVSNSVNLKTGRVTGIFANVKAKMSFPPAQILHLKLTPRELTSIVLHEVGHFFTYLEYIDRNSSANRVLASLVEEFTKITTDGERVKLIKQVVEVLEVPKEREEELVKETDVKFLVIGFVTEVNQNYGSQTNSAHYDFTSTEQLADQYCARYGYAREIATSLDKIGYLFTENSKALRAARYLNGLIEPLVIGSAAALLIPVAIVPILLCTYSAIFLNIAMSGSENKDYTYDEPTVRIKRIREQLIQMSKNQNIDKESVIYISDSIKDIDEIIKRTINLGGLLHAISDFILPGSRKVAASIKLQRQLEELASNDLFLSAAKLRTI